MKRSALDKLVSTLGVVIAIVLLLSSGVLFFAYHFVHGQVYDQLAAEKIYFPAKGSAGLTALPAADQTAVSQYAGQQLTTGAQAEVFANHYIAVHLKEIGGDKTYSELSAQSQADPSNQKLAGQVDTIFKGETLRGILLNAYAFDTMAVVALVASIGAFIGGLVFIVLALLGFRHAKKVTAPRKK